MIEIVRRVEKCKRIKNQNERNEMLKYSVCAYMRMEVESKKDREREKKT
jgi:hypothetical protein